MWFALPIAAALALYNNVLNLFRWHKGAYVPLNLTVAGGLIVAARARGYTWSDLGFGREGIGPGLRFGGIVALVIVAGLAAAVLVPHAERFLADRRVAGVGLGQLAYRTLVRIPFGTALFEEVAFRGVLFGVLAREHSVTFAIVGSSAVFGLWHVVPSIELIRVNELATTTPGVVLGVAVAVVLTALAGAGFSWLRLATGGIVAPVVVHAATNSFATVAAYLAQRASL